MKGAESNFTEVPGAVKSLSLFGCTRFVSFNIMGKQGSAKKGKAKDDGEEKQTKVFYCRVPFFSYTLNELWGFE